MRGCPGLECLASESRYTPLGRPFRTSRAQLPWDERAGLNIAALFVRMKFSHLVQSAVLGMDMLKAAGRQNTQREECGLDERWGLQRLLSAIVQN